MDLKDIFTLCAKLKYPKQQTLYEYFDAVTFVGSVDEFFVATFQYLADLDNTSSSQEFRSFLYENLISHIVIQYKTPQVSQPKKANILPNASDKARRIASGQSKINNAWFIHANQPQYRETHDDFYEIWYENYWQDNDCNYFLKANFSMMND